jgi:hypothetical protein
MKKHNFVRSFVCAGKFVADFKGWTQTGSVWEQGAKNIWNKEV